ncbi:MAG TPA: adenosine deaminase, partial [Candidatus Angelobacter sp.]|nr:adenosine deaminase [Candidatus Angelobacter sp.]
MILLAALAPAAWTQNKTNPKKAVSTEQRASRYFDSVRNQPLLLHAFLADMPKGGDLHNHLSGAIYAESFI